MRYRLTRSGVDTGLQSRKSLRRVLRSESIEPRILLAADLHSEEFHLLPKEPLEMLLADQAHYRALSESQGGADGDSGDIEYLVALSDTFRLHSRPSATKTVYLDFDGFTAIGTPWNSIRNSAQIVSPAWDPDGNGAAFTDNELRRIQGVWQRVASDFSAFDVNVTTEDPGEADLVFEGDSDTHWGIRVVFTPDDFPGPGSGGVAFINSFNWGYGSAGATDTPTYVFNLAEWAAAAAASHEVGHTMGLAHDGTTAAHPTQPSQEYYNGHGVGENGWGPIMGSGYYQNVTTWDDGTYFASSNGGAGANYGRGSDDLQVITSNNGFGYIPDPEGNSVAAAQPLEIVNDYDTSIASLSQFGTISRSSDIDVFRFQAGAGLLNLTIDPYVTQAWVTSPGGTLTRSIETAYFDSNSWALNQGANLDVVATLYDSDGAVIATSNPDGLRASFTDVAVTAGTYFIGIEGGSFGTPTINPPTGYSNYASLGQYLVTGTAPVALGLRLAGETVNYTEGQSPVQVTSTASVIDGIAGDYSNGQLAVSVAPFAGATDRLGFSPVGLSLDGSNVLDGGQIVAVMSQAGATRLNFDLTSEATASSISKLARSITFEASGDSPDTGARSVRFQLTKGSASANDLIGVSVIPTNDAPSLDASRLSDLPEDTSNSVGQTVAEIFTASFSDPDRGDRLAGVAVVQNDTPASQGKWQYSTDTGVWEDLATGAIDRLALGIAASLRFVPAQDYFGAVAPIMVLGIDNSYAGEFTTAGNPVYLPETLQGPESPVATRAAEVSIEITPVNDKPVALLPELRFSVEQDQPLSAQIPANAFADLEDSFFSYSSLQANGATLPGWLRLDSANGLFLGTPSSLDVFEVNLILTAEDSGGLTASLPVVIDVINVNDAPSGLRMGGTSVIEGAENVRVGRLLGFDVDGDSFSWTSSDPRFSIVGDEVFLVEALDFENPDEQQIPVTFEATDSGTPPLSSSFEVLIQTRDANEFYPELPSKTYTLIDGSAAGTVVDQLQAIDKDTAQTVKYRLHSGDMQIFMLDENSGELRLAQSPSFAQSSEYKVFIEAYDNGSPSLSTISQFLIEVQPANLSAPVFPAGQVLSFSENVAAGSLLGKVAATDADGTPLRFEVLAVNGGAANWVEIDPDTGEITATSANEFDYESLVDYSVEVRVVELATEARTVSQVVPIQLLDANDPPMGVGELTVYPQRQGVSATSEFVVEDQDVSEAGYTLSTSDSRFEVRDGRLALRPNQVIAAAQAGQTLTVRVQIVDNADPTSSAEVDATVFVASVLPWQNPLNSLDVNRDGLVTPADALQVINLLNEGSSSRPLPLVRDFDELDAGEVDTNGDGFLSASDVLLVINHLNRAAGEGEASRRSSPSVRVQPADDLWYAAFSQIEEENARRRR